MPPARLTWEPEVTDFLLNTFVTLLVVRDPVGLVPVYIGLTTSATKAERRVMALRGVGIAALVLLAFSLGGQALLGALGVGLPAFRIAGGLLLFLLAMDMILARQTGARSATDQEQDEARQHKDISVFPLAIPLIAGPGAMTSLLLLMGRAGDDPLLLLSLFGLLLLVLGLCLIALLFSGHLMRMLGITGSNVVSRVLGIILAALAVQFVLDGIRGSGLVS